MGPLVTILAAIGCLAGILGLHKSERALHLMAKTRAELDQKIAELPDIVKAAVEPAIAKAVTETVSNQLAPIIKSIKDKSVGSTDFQAEVDALDKFAGDLPAAISGDVAPAIGKAVADHFEPPAETPAPPTGGTDSAPPAGSTAPPA